MALAKVRSASVSSFFGLLRCVGHKQDGHGVPGGENHQFGNALSIVEVLLRSHLSICLRLALVDENKTSLRLSGASAQMLL